MLKHRVIPSAIFLSNYWTKISKYIGYNGIGYIGIGYNGIVYNGIGYFVTGYNGIVYIVLTPTQGYKFIVKKIKINLK